MNDLLEELKGWQGAIGAGFGFVALVAGALLNFHLTRRRDAKVRHEDALAVAAALYGEIVLLREEAARLARVVAGASGNVDEHILKAFPLSEPMLYKALAGKVGTLSADLVLAVTEFHQHLQEVRTALPLLIKDPERDYLFSPLMVLVPARDAVTKIVPALRKIEAMTNVREPTAEALDLGRTAAVIDMHEDFYNTP